MSGPFNHGPASRGPNDPPGSRGAVDGRPRAATERAGAPAPPPAASAGLRDRLAGDWRVRRSIREGGPRGLRARFAGDARIAPAPGDQGLLRHVEEGRLWLPSGPVAASRTYLWRFSNGEAAASLRYADGAPLVEFVFAQVGAEGGGSDGPGGRSRARGTHLCGDDCYEAALTLGADHVGWSLVWRVTGPRKRIWIATRFAPMDASEPLAALAPPAPQNRSSDPWDDADSAADAC